MILQTIEQYYTWALIAILLLNLAQRKIPGTYKKKVCHHLPSLDLASFRSRSGNHTLQRSEPQPWLVGGYHLRGAYFLVEKASPSVPFPLC